MELEACAAGWAIRSVCETDNQLTALTGSNGIRAAVLCECSSSGSDDPFMGVRHQRASAAQCVTPRRSGSITYEEPGEAVNRMGPAGLRECSSTRIPDGLVCVGNKRASVQGVRATCGGPVPEIEGAETGNRVGPSGLCEASSAEIADQLGCARH